jgi:hypothetical protein
VDSHQSRGRTRRAGLHSTSTSYPSTSPRAHSVPASRRFCESDRTHGWPLRRLVGGRDAVNLGDREEEGAYVMSRSASLDEDEDTESFGLYYSHLHDM